MKTEKVCVCEEVFDRVWNFALVYKVKKERKLMVAFMVILFNQVDECVD